MDPSASPATFVGTDIPLQALPLLSHVISEAFSPVALGAASPVVGLERAFMDFLPFLSSEHLKGLLKEAQTLLIPGYQMTFGPSAKHVLKYGEQASQRYFSTATGKPFTADAHTLLGQFVGGIELYHNSLPERLAFQFDTTVIFNKGAVNSDLKAETFSRLLSCAVQGDSQVLAAQVISIPSASRSTLLWILEEMFSISGTMREWNVDPQSHKLWARSMGWTSIAPHQELGLLYDVVAVSLYPNYQKPLFESTVQDAATRVAIAKSALDVMCGKRSAGKDLVYPEGTLLASGEVVE